MFNFQVLDIFSFSITCTFQSVTNTREIFPTHSSDLVDSWRERPRLSKEKDGPFSNKEFGWPCRVGRFGGLLFRTHSEQRARASRGQILSPSIPFSDLVALLVSYIIARQQTPAQLQPDLFQRRQ